MRDANDRERETFYDILGRVTRVDNEMDQAVIYRYDAAGRRYELEDALILAPGTRFPYHSILDPVLLEAEQMRSPRSRKSHSLSVGVSQMLKSALPLLLASSTAVHALPAFPGAQGHGAASAGGRGGRVIEVTNLNDSGPGSLREACGASGKRIVVFRVGGTIEAKSKIHISNPYITIAGQTAPGGGILIKSSDAAKGEALWLRDGAHDVIIRYLRFRAGKHGDVGGKSGSGIHIFPSVYNVIVDHCSFSWAADKNIGVWFQYWYKPTDKLERMTFSRNLIAESLKESTGLNINGFKKSGKRYYALIRDISIHHNLFMSNTHRNPCISTGGAQVINNVVYNYKWAGGQTYQGTSDFIGNYYRPGPMNPGAWHGVAIQSLDPESTSSVYVKGNLHTVSLKNPEEDNWPICASGKKVAPTAYRRTVPLPRAPIPVEITDARKAYDDVLLDVGANARLNAKGDYVPNHDDVDKRLMNEIRAGGGIKESPVDEFAAGGHPTIQSGTPYADADHDGMPDIWEKANGLDPNDDSDRNKTNLSPEGYTNIEVFLNGQRGSRSGIFRKSR